MLWVGVRGCYFSLKFTFVTEIMRVFRLQCFLWIVFFIFLFKILMIRPLKILYEAVYLQISDILDQKFRIIVIKILFLLLTFVNSKKMYNRLKKWMDSEGLKSSQLADNIGVNRATISHILSARNKPSIEFLQKLLNRYSNLNSNWLITGIGYMHVKNETTAVKVNKNIEKVVIFYDDASFEQVNS